nr:hypothetical protein [Tanacetum cinerariifolium]
MFPGRHVGREIYPRRQVAQDSPDMSLGKMANVVVYVYLPYRWSAIASRLPGRSDNDVKNHWRSHLKKRASEQNLASGATTKNKLNSLPTFETESSEAIQQPANHIRASYG